MNTGRLLDDILPRLLFTPDELDAGIADVTQDGVPFSVRILRVSNDEVRISIIWESYIERLLRSFSEDEDLLKKDYQRQLTVVDGSKMNNLPYTAVLQRIRSVVGHDEVFERVVQVLNQRLPIDCLRLVNIEGYIPLDPYEKGPIALIRSLYGVKVTQEIKGQLLDVKTSEPSPWSYRCKVELDVGTGEAKHVIIFSRFENQNNSLLSLFKRFLPL